MSQLNLVIIVCLGYVLSLFLVAFFAERAAAQGRAGWLRSPIVYTLSLSIYCTAWTFYGAVGNAARSGLEYLTIYIGPTIVMFGWWWLLRKLVRIGRTQRITSLADLVSARFGKSNALAIGLTILAVIGTTPYIALQLQSVTQSFEVFAVAEFGQRGENSAQTGFWVALGLGLFTVLFGTRNLDVNERHHGVVMAIAVEAVVKLTALLAVGIFVVWGLAGGLTETLARIDASELGRWDVRPGRWAGLTLLAAAAFMCLPRMFQVLVVENEDEGHLRTASWAFPLYLMLMSLFVVPIAVLGLESMPAGSNPDMFVLSVPLSQGQNGLAIFSFLGGFSSATSMVIVAAIALSTMVSNHIVMPIWLHSTGSGASFSGDVRDVVILARRLSILGVLFLGYLYFRVSGGGTALTTIGLVSFAGITQVLPILIGGIFWRGATRIGALSGLAVGSAIWLYTSFLPSIGSGFAFFEALQSDGLWGMSWLRTDALFGIEGMDPILHTLLWSLSLSTITFLIVSLITFPSPLERLQGAQFVNIFQHTAGPRGWSGGTAQSEDLMVMAQRILGANEAVALFEREARMQGATGSLPETNPEFLERLERELSGSVGAATAHAMVGQIVGGMQVSVHDLMAVADETAQMMEYSSKLEAQSDELTRTARKLREANTKLTRLSVQKDAFLSQISHELRTPMTSVRAFSEILRDTSELSQEDHTRYASIIHDEAIRLTRLLDDLLDLSVLENGQVTLNRCDGWLYELLDRAAATAQGAGSAQDLDIRRTKSDEEVWLSTDLDRLTQVFINLIGNAHKYCDGDPPKMWIRVSQDADQVILEFADNGSGIAPESRELVFEKFARVADQKAGGAGLGLAICRQIVRSLGGEIRYVSSDTGAVFQMNLPVTLRFS
ncbi:MAG: sensor histidine kinase [Pseudoprimorskyibacter sp.]|nr:sensor histidine kinase [Pseudoprimorskyibacter sp.]